MKNKINKKYVWIAVVCVIIVLAVGGYFVFAHKDNGSYRTGSSMMNRPLRSFSNFTLDNATLQKTTSFLDSTKNLTEAQAYCRQSGSQNGYYCMYYCRQVNPQNEICQGLIRPYNMSGRGNFSRSGQ